MSTFCPNVSTFCPHAVNQLYSCAVFEFERRSEDNSYETFKVTLRRLPFAVTSLSLSHTHSLSPGPYPTWSLACLYKRVCYGWVDVHASMLSGTLQTSSTLENAK